MSQSMSQSVFLADMLKRSTALGLKSAAAVQEKNRFRQLAPEKATPAWLLGHLAFAMDAVLVQLTLGGSGVIPPEYGICFAPGFAGGKPVTSNPADYPAWDDIVANYGKAAESAVATIAAFPPDQLDTPIPEGMPEMLRSMFGTRLNAVAYITNHDAYHIGQLALIDKLG